MLRWERFFILLWTSSSREHDCRFELPSTSFKRGRRADDLRHSKHPHCNCIGFRMELIPERKMASASVSDAYALRRRLEA